MKNTERDLSQIITARSNNGQLTISGKISLDLWLSELIYKYNHLIWIKNLLLIPIILFFNLTAACSFSHSPTDNMSEVFIDEGIIEELESSGQARVIIALHDSIDNNVSDRERKARIAAMQESVIGLLSTEDFQLIRTYDSVPAIVGILSSRDALNILRKHPLVASIILDEPGGGSEGGVQ